MSAAENEKLGQVREISPKVSALQNQQAMDFGRRDISPGAKLHKKRLTALRKAVATTAHTSNGSALRDKRNLLLNQNNQSNGRNIDIDNVKVRRAVNHSHQSAQIQKTTKNTSKNRASQGNPFESDPKFTQRMLNAVQQRESSARDSGQFHIETRTPSMLENFKFVDPDSYMVKKEQKDTSKFVRQRREEVQRSQLDKHLKLIQNPLNNRINKRPSTVFKSGQSHALNNLTDLKIEKHHVERINRPNKVTQKLMDRLSSPPNGPGPNQMRKKTPEIALVSFDRRHVPVKTATRNSSMGLKRPSTAKPKSGIEKKAKQQEPFYQTNNNSFMRAEPAIVHTEFTGEQPQPPSKAYNDINYHKSTSSRLTQEARDVELARDNQGAKSQGNFVPYDSLEKRNASQALIQNGSDHKLIKGQNASTKSIEQNSGSREWMYQSVSKKDISHSHHDSMTSITVIQEQGTKTAKRSKIVAPRATDRYKNHKMSGVYENHQKRDSTPILQERKHRKLKSTGIRFTNTAILPAKIQSEQLDGSIEGEVISVEIDQHSAMTGFNSQAKHNMSASVYNSNPTRQHLQKFEEMEEDLKKLFIPPPKLELERQIGNSQKQHQTVLKPKFSDNFSIKWAKNEEGLMQDPQIVINNGAQMFNEKLPILIASYLYLKPGAFKFYPKSFTKEDMEPIVIFDSFLRTRKVHQKYMKTFKEEACHRESDHQFEQNMHFVQKTDELKYLRKPVHFDTYEDEIQAIDNVSNIMFSNEKIAVENSRTFSHTNYNVKCKTLSHKWQMHQQEVYESNDPHSRVATLPSDGIILDKKNMKFREAMLRRVFLAAGESVGNHAYKTLMRKQSTKGIVIRDIMKELDSEHFALIKTDLGHHWSTQFLPQADMILEINVRNRSQLYEIAKAKLKKLHQTLLEVNRVPKDFLRVLNHTDYDLRKRQNTKYEQVFDIQSLKINMFVYARHMWKEPLQQLKQTNKQIKADIIESVNKEIISYRKRRSPATLNEHIVEYHFNQESRLDWSFEKYNEFVFSDHPKAMPKAYAVEKAIRDDTTVVTRQWKQSDFWLNHNTREVLIDGLYGIKSDYILQGTAGDNRYLNRLDWKNFARDKIKLVYNHFRNNQRDMEENSQSHSDEEPNCDERIAGYQLLLAEADTDQECDNFALGFYKSTFVRPETDTTGVVWPEVIKIHHTLYDFNSPQAYWLKMPLYQLALCNIYGTSYRRVQFDRYEADRQNEKARIEKREKMQRRWLNLQKRARAEYIEMIRQTTEGLDRNLQLYQEDDKVSMSKSVMEPVIEHDTEELRISQIVDETLKRVNVRIRDGQDSLSSDEMNKNRAEVKGHGSEHTPSKSQIGTPRKTVSDVTEVKVDTKKGQKFEVQRRSRSAERATKTMIRTRQHALPTFDEYFKLEFRFDPEASQKSFHSASDDEDWNRRRHKDSQYAASVGREFDMNSDKRNSKQDELDWNDEFEKEDHDYRRDEVNEVHPCFDQNLVNKLMRQQTNISAQPSITIQTQQPQCSSLGGKDLEAELINSQPTVPDPTTPRYKGLQQPQYITGTDDIYHQINANLDEGAQELGAEHAVVELDFKMFQEIKEEILSGDLEKAINQTPSADQTTTEQLKVTDQDTASPIKPGSGLIGEPSAASYVQQTTTKKYTYNDFSSEEEEVSMPQHELSLLYNAKGPEQREYSSNKIQKKIPFIKLDSYFQAEVTKDFLRSVRQKNYKLTNNYIKRFCIDLESSKDDLGNTALNIAAQMGDRKMVTLLLEIGASQHTKNNVGRSPSDYAYEFFNDEVHDTLREERRFQ